MRETKFKQTEVGMIPSDWEIKSIGELTNVLTGYPFPGNTILERGNIRLLRGVNITEGQIRHSADIDRYYSGNIDCLREYILRENDLVIGMDGSKVGKNSAVISGSNSGNLLVQRVARLRMKKSVQPISYIFYFIASNYFISYIDSLKTNSAIPHISPSDIRNFKIPLPPTIEEQKRIAQALSDVDAVISTTEKLIAKKKALNQGAMQTLLSGKMRIQNGKWIKTTHFKQTELGPIPQEWEVKRIGNFCKVYDGTHQTPKYVDFGIPFFSVENVSANDFNHTKFISLDEYMTISKRAAIKKGDILMTRIGSIGVCKYVDWDKKAGFYVSLALLKCNDGINPQFLVHYTCTNAFKKEIELHSLTTAIPQKINLGPIAHVRIAVPSNIEEQTAIATVLSDMDSEITALETKLAKYRQLKTGMMQQLLTGKVRLV